MNETMIRRGEVVDERDSRIEVLEQELDELRDENRGLKAALRAKDGESQRAVAALRSVLAPMYQALKMVFGELDAIGVAEATEAPASTSAWATWQQKLGASSPASRMIGVLLDHGPSTTKQIQAAAKMGEATVYKAASKLGQLQLVEKSGGRYSLKKL